MVAMLLGAVVALARNRSKVALAVRNFRTRIYQLEQPGKDFFNLFIVCASMVAAGLMVWLVQFGSPPLLFAPRTDIALAELDQASALVGGLVAFAYSMYGVRESRMSRQADYQVLPVYQRP